MKKAQAALEFLMTYGWAILVVLVAIGALAFFGVFSPQNPFEKAGSDAVFLCNNLKVNGTYYPEYQETTSYVQTEMSGGTFYIPESVNLEERRARPLRTEVEYDSGSSIIDRYTLDEENNLLKVWCVVPSEVCYYIGNNFTKCMTGNDRMQFDYQRWLKWSCEERGVCR